MLVTNHGHQFVGGFPFDLFPQRHIDERVLQERRHDERHTRRHPHVDGLDVADLRQRHGCRGTLRRHGEDCENPQGRSSGDGVLVEPVRDPRYGDDKTAGNVHVQKVKTNSSLENEVHRQAGKVTCRGNKHLKT